MTMAATLLPQQAAQGARARRRPTSQCTSSAPSPSTSAAWRRCESLLCGLLLHCGSQVPSISKYGISHTIACSTHPVPSMVHALQALCAYSISRSIVRGAAGLQSQASRAANAPVAYEQPAQQAMLQKIKVAAQAVAGRSAHRQRTSPTTGHTGTQPGSAALDNEWCFHFGNAKARPLSATIVRPEWVPAGAAPDATFALSRFRAGRPAVGVAVTHDLEAPHGDRAYSTSGFTSFLPQPPLRSRSATAAAGRARSVSPARDASREADMPRHDAPGTGLHAAVQNACGGAVWTHLRDRARSSSGNHAGCSTGPRLHSPDERSEWQRVPDQLRAQRAAQAAPSRITVANPQKGFRQRCARHVF
jgi:hypothetical protein